MSVEIDLSGKTALVTGGSRGIGAAVVSLLHGAGARVVVNHLGTGETESDARQLAANLEAERPGTTLLAAANVANTEEIAAMLDLVRSEWGALDLLVNNAGILRDRTVAKMTKDDWDGVLEVNLSGVFHCCRLALPVLNEGGAVVNMASVSGMGGFFGQANYSAAKAGVIALTKVLSKEWARRKIRVNAVAPGVVETAMAATIPEQARTEMLKDIPWQRFGSAEEAARVVLFLCSDLASYVTGETIVVSGGWNGW
jgi:3-oxoacyl-[acyl-carrier protein] reductase